LLAGQPLFALLIPDALLLVQPFAPVVRFAPLLRLQPCAPGIAYTAAVGGKLCGKVAVQFDAAVAVIRANIDYSLL